MEAVVSDTIVAGGTAGAVTAAERATVATTVPTRHDRPLTPPPPVQAFLQRLHDRHRSNRDGTVATYIPALAAADPDWFGIALLTVDGTGYHVGDSTQPFTIQSISKPFTYGLVLDDLGEAPVRHRIGVEPTGDAFNSITLAPGTGTPLNPMVNAGAIAAASLVAETDQASGLERILARYGAAAGRPLALDAVVFDSERETGHRNRAIGHLLRASGVIDGDPDEALDRYFAQCSISVDATALAMMAATLANGGVNPRTGERVMSASTVRAVLSVMSSCGMYDSAGDWLYTVGLPAKSGVSGGILAVVPGQLGIGVFSPPLDSRGNSVRGVAVCRDLAHDLDLHLVGRGPATAPPLRARHTVARLASKRTRTEGERVVLARAGWQAEVRELQGDLTFLAVESAVRGLEDPSVGPRWAVLAFGRVLRVEATAISLLADLVESVRASERDVFVCGWAAHLGAMDALDTLLVARGLGPVRRFADADHAREWCEDRILEEAEPAGGEPDGTADVGDVGDATLLRGMEADDAAAVRARLDRRRFAPGAAIVRRGEPAHELFLITSGRLSVTVDRPGGGQRRLTTLSSGTVFGELAFVSQETRTADVHADTVVECQVLSAEAFADLMTQEPRAAAAVLANLLRVVGATARRLTDELALVAD
jgi:glutaminase